MELPAANCFICEPEGEFFHFLTDLFTGSLKLFLLLAGFDPEKDPDQHHRQDDAHHAQGIGHSISQGNLGDFGDLSPFKGLTQRFLRSTQPRGIGNSPRHDPHHHGHRHPPVHQIVKGDGNSYPT